MEMEGIKIREELDMATRYADEHHEQFAGGYEGGRILKYAMQHDYFDVDGRADLEMRFAELYPQTYLAARAESLKWTLGALSELIPLATLDEVYYYIMDLGDE